jgi:hypothetical protein|tara:strand:+ start:375 stop:530 length:156 start_codon:yes stop_codon:yes gene_type:complete
MIADWQIMLLDQGLWIVPLLGVGALVVFPWKHWVSILDEQSEEGEKSNESR